MANLSKEFDGLAGKLDAGAPVELISPYTGEPVGVTIWIASYSSQTVREAARKLAFTRVVKSGDGMDISYDEAEESALKTMIGAIVKWEGIEDDDGNDMECTPENVRSILINPDLFWIREQLDDTAKELDNFTKA